MTDDSAGLRALEALEQRYELPETVDVLDGGTLGLDLLPRVEGYGNVLIADCVTIGREPGTLVQVEGEDVPTVFARCLSPHQMGLQDLIAVLQLQGRMPERLTVIGVEPESLEVGLELSEPVRSSLPRMVEAMLSVASSWGLEIRSRDATPRPE